MPAPWGGSWKEGSHIKVYVSATFESRLELRPIKEAIWHLGHELTSSWLDEVARPPHMTEEEFKRKLAMKDIAEVSEADLLIIDANKVSGGKNCELGVALGRHQRTLVWCVGPATNVFQYLADRMFTDWAACLECLKREYPVARDRAAEQV